ncbi:MAG: T9SS type A sorting domain-containing protein, partial [Bacteroidota bacterium]
GISIAKTSENIIDINSNNKLLYEYGKLEGDYPIEAKFSALLDGKPVIQKYSIDESNVIINNESAKMWNWKYLRALEDKKNKTKKESNDLVNRSITNRILTMQTAFLCLEPWMMKRDTIDNGSDNTSVQEDMTEAGLEITYGPNPIENNLSIKLNITNVNTKILNIKIYDVLGNVVKEFRIDSFANTLNLNWDANSENHGKVAPGVYYLVINTNVGSKVIRLVVV